MGTLRGWKNESGIHYVRLELRCKTITRNELLSFTLKFVVMDSEEIISVLFYVNIIRHACVTKKLYYVRVVCRELKQERRVI